MAPTKVDTTQQFDLEFKVLTRLWQAGRGGERRSGERSPPESGRSAKPPDPATRTPAGWGTNWVTEFSQRSRTSHIGSAVPKTILSIPLILSKLPISMTQTEPVLRACVVSVRPLPFFGTLAL